MIIGTGIDLVDITELQENIEAKGEPFLRRIFTEDESAYARQRADPFQVLGGRFAAKEACLKAFGTGWTDETDWLQMEVTNDPSGRPSLKLQGDLATRGSMLGVEHVWLSISHIGQYAVAEVILER
jgi:holo-[acyl-carrier protein] synthase